MEYPLIIVGLLSLMSLLPTTTSFPETQIRPGYGIKYETKGFMFTSLNRYDLVVGIALPTAWDKARPYQKIGQRFKDLMYDYCEKIRIDGIAKRTCYSLLSVADDFKRKETYHQLLIAQIFKYDLKALLPDDTETDLNDDRGRSDTVLRMPDPARQTPIPTSFLSRGMTMEDFMRYQERLITEIDPDETLRDEDWQRLFAHLKSQGRDRPRPTTTMSTEKFAQLMEPSTGRNRNRNNQTDRQRDELRGATRGKRSISDSDFDNIPKESMDYANPFWFNQWERNELQNSAKNVYNDTWLSDFWNVYFEEIHRQNTSHSRQKRQLGAIMAVGGLVMKGVNMFLEHKKEQKIKKAIHYLQDRQVGLEHNIQRVHDNLLSVAKSTMKEIDALHRITGLHSHQIVVLVSFLRNAIVSIRLGDQDQNLAIDHIVFLLGQVQIHMDRIIDYYLNLEDKGSHLINAIETLNTGRISKHLVAPYDLREYLEHVRHEIQKDFPNYELAMPKLHMYYDMSFTTYAVEDNIIYIHIPVLFKHKDSHPLELYKVTSIPIPYDPDQLKPNEKGIYQGPHTQITVNNEYLAVGENIYLDFDEDILDQCMELHGIYYCEGIFLIKHVKDHTCNSAIFHNKTELVNKICDIKYLDNYTPIPQIWNLPKHIYLVDLPVPWQIYCSESVDIPQDVQETPLALIKREDLCYCGLSAAHYFLQEDLLYCRKDMSQERDNIPIYHTVNTAVVQSFGDSIHGIEEYGNQLVIDLAKMNADLETRQSKIVLDGNVITKSDLDIDVPDLDILEEDLSNVAILADKEVVTTDLEKVITSIQQDQTMFETKGDFTMHTRSMDKWFKYDRYWMIFLFTAGIIGLIGFLVTVVICFKFQSGSTRTLSSSQMQTEISKLLAAGIGLNTFGQARAIKVTVTWNNKQITDLINMDIAWEAKDVMISLGMYFGIGLTLYILYFGYRKLKECRISYLNQKKHCESLICNGWNDQTDIYLQIASKNCMASMKFYLGTLLGQPKEIVVRGKLTINHLSYNKGCFYDSVRINWQQKHLELDSETFYLPDKVVIGIFKRFMGRHLFCQNDLLCDLAFVYNNQLVIKSIVLKGETISPEMNKIALMLKEKVDVIREINKEPLESVNVVNEPSGSQNQSQSEVVDNVFMHDQEKQTERQKGILSKELEQVQDVLKEELAGIHSDFEKGLTSYQEMQKQLEEIKHWQTEFDKDKIAEANSKQIQTEKEHELEEQKQTEKEKSAMQRFNAVTSAYQKMCGPRVPTAPPMEMINRINIEPSYRRSFRMSKITCVNCGQEMYM